jgi:hypothetical protein
MSLTCDVCGHYVEGFDLTTHAGGRVCLRHYLESVWARVSRAVDSGWGPP